METYSTMFGLLALFLIISAVIGYRDRQRKDRIERQTLQEAFGKPGCKEYPDGRLAQIQASADRHSAPFTIDAITARRGSTAVLPAAKKGLSGGRPTIRRGSTYSASSRPLAEAANIPSMITWT